MSPEQLVVAVLATYAPRGAEVWSGGLARLLNDFGSAPGAARTALSRLAQRGVLGRRRDGRFVVYRLSERSERLAAARRSRFEVVTGPAADPGSWTVVCHAAPSEGGRTGPSPLGRRLRDLGFRPAVAGMWVSVHDQAEAAVVAAEDIGLGERVVVWRATPAEGAGLRTLAGEWWDLDGLERRYADVIAMLRDAERQAARLSDRDALVLRVSAREDAYDLAAWDPGAGVTSVGADRHEAVRTLLGSVERALAAGAERHFRATVGAQPR
jgi:phenylacetic acid degradation operon negative regulatory protein